MCHPFFTTIMTFSTERLEQLRNRVHYLTQDVGNDTEESINRECSNGFNDEDWAFLEHERIYRLNKLEALEEAKQQLQDYLTQYD